MLSVSPASAPQDNNAPFETAYISNELPTDSSVSFGELSTVLEPTAANSTMSINLSATEANANGEFTLSTGIVTPTLSGQQVVLELEIFYNESEVTFVEDGSTYFSTSLQNTVNGCCYYMWEPSDLASWSNLNLDNLVSGIKFQLADGVESAVISCNFNCNGVDYTDKITVERGEVVISSVTLSNQVTSVKDTDTNKEIATVTVQNITNPTYTVYVNNSASSNFKVQNGKLILVNALSEGNYSIYVSANGTKSNTFTLNVVGSEIEINVNAVFVNAPGSSDMANVLPTSLSEIRKGETVYVEIWMKNTDATAKGISAGSVDISFDPALLNAESLIHSNTYNTLVSGTIGTGEVSNFSGGTLSGDYGRTEWVRLGYVKMTAVEEGVAELGVSAGTYQFAQSASGNLSWDEIGFTGATIEVVSACIYDIDDSGFIDFGDFSYFAGAFGKNADDSTIVGPNGATACGHLYDFDQSGFIDFGDFSYFAGAFGKSADDAEIVYPNIASVNLLSVASETGVALSPTTSAPIVAPVAAASEFEIDVQLTAVSTPTSSDTNNNVPNSLKTVQAGDKFYLEVWVQDVSELQKGVSGGSVDINFDNTKVTADELYHGNLYSTLLSGTIGAGVIDNFGGGTLTGNQGVGKWVRLGYVEMTANSSDEITFDLSEGSMSFAIHQSGNRAWDKVNLESLTLNEASPTPVVTLSDTVTTVLDSETKEIASVTTNIEDAKYNVYVNGQISNDITVQNGKLVIVNALTAGEYSVYVDVNGTKSETFTLTVNEVPVVTVVQSVTEIMNYDMNMEIATVTTNIENVAEYKVYVNGQISDKLAVQNGKLVLVDTLVADTYSIMVEADGTQSAILNLTVIAPTITLTPSVKEVMDSETNKEIATVTTNIKNPTYTVYANDTETNDITVKDGKVVIINALAVGNYVIKVDVNGKISSEFNLNVTITPIVTLTPSVTNVMDNETNREIATVTTNIENAKYNVYVNGQVSSDITVGNDKLVIVNALKAGEYSIYVDVDGTQSAAFTLNVATPVITLTDKVATIKDYELNKVLATVTTNIENPTYSVSVNEVASNDIVLQNDKLVVVNTLTVGEYSIIVSANGTQSETFTLAVVEAIPVVTVTPTVTTVMDKDTNKEIASVTIEDIQNPVYTVYVNDQVSNDFTVQNGKLVLINALTAGEYSIKVDANGTQSEAFILTVTEAPSITVSTDDGKNVLVTWDAVEGTKEYVVQYRQEGDKKWKTEKLAGNDTDFTFRASTYSSLKGKDYEIRVLADGVLIAETSANLLESVKVKTASTKADSFTLNVYELDADANALRVTNGKNSAIVMLDGTEVALGTIAVKYVDGQLIFTGATAKTLYKLTVQAATVTENGTICSRDENAYVRTAKATLATPTLDRVTATGAESVLVAWT
ncbi:MAG: hypothetical protein Q4C70_07440, partial [Planctomycetia bacterium]|nr:hypothetical protein [Planctomycetia bacterium]